MTEPPKLVGVHEVAGPAIKRIRSWAGLLGFFLALLVGLRTGTPFATACLHAIFAGVVASTVAWWAAVSFFRHVLVARVRASLRRRD